MKITRTDNPRVNDIDFNNIDFGRVFTDHMFVMAYENGAWKNPEIKPYTSFQLAPSCAALHYGQTIFEGLKAYSYPNQKVSLFRPEENIKRMNLSAKRICMPTVDKDVVLEGLSTLVDVDRQWVPSDGASALYIRPFMFSTDEYLGVRASQRYLFVIFCSPVGAYYNKPLSVKVETEYIRSAKGGTGAAKFGGNYAGSLMPTSTALNEGYDQIIWTDAQTHEYIEEAGTMNLMFVKNGTIITPLTSGTILDGITRKSILKLVESLNIKQEVRPIKIQELIEGIEDKSITEIFGVGTAATVATINVVGYNNKKYTLEPVKNSIASIIYDQLEGIKRGKYDDQFDWLTLI